jgi:ABC-type bacteriocin/lantibiotic exporter with double-glycine peptidase domain
LAAISLELANPQILRVFIDSATQSADMNRLVAIGLVFPAVAVATHVVAIAETFVAETSA